VSFGVSFKRLINVQRVGIIWLSCWSDDGISLEVIRAVKEEFGGRLP
jgi:hypothetical protein